MLPSNPNYTKPYVNYLRVDVPKGNVSIVGTISKVRGAIEATITWQATTAPLTSVQADAYALALVKVCNWAKAQGANAQGNYWTPGRVRDSVSGLAVTRFMFHDDPARLISASRKALAFGMYTKPSFTIDGGSGNIPTAMQVVTTLQQSIRDSIGWR